MTLHFNAKTTYNSNSFFEYPHLHRLVNQQLKSPNKQIIIPDNFSQKRKITSGMIDRCMYQINLIIKRMLHILQQTLSKSYRQKFSAASEKIINAYTQKISTIVITKLEEKIDANQEKIKSEATKLKTKIDTIKQDVTSKESTIKNLETAQTKELLMEKELEQRIKFIQGLINIEALEQEHSEINIDTHPFGKTIIAPQLEAAKKTLVKFDIEQKILSFSKDQPVEEKTRLENSLQSVNLDIEIQIIEARQFTLLKENYNSQDDEDPVDKEARRATFRSNMEAFASEMERLTKERNKPENTFVYDSEETVTRIKAQFTRDGSTTRQILEEQNEELRLLKERNITAATTINTKKTELEDLKTTLAENERSYKKIAHATPV